MSVGPTVRFGRLHSGSSVAYASMGSGRPLVMLPGWLCHVRESWSHPAAASARARLARHHRFLWYDRLGCGLSDHHGFELSVDNDVAQLEAVLDAAGIERASLIGYSFGAGPAAVFAARYPERVERLVLYSAFARGSAVTTPERFEALKHLVRMHWGLGSRALAAMIVPTGSSRDIQWFTCFQQVAASAAMAEALLDHIRSMDVRAWLPEVRTPTMVLHHRDDHAVPLSAGQEVAALLPDCVLQVLEGNEHDPFIRDSGSVVETLLGFLSGRATATSRRKPDAPVALSQREREVLALIAEGLSNKAISTALDITTGTVERHACNIYGKLGVRCRAEAVRSALTMDFSAPPPSI